MVRAKVPAVSICPPVRCYERLGTGAGALCGEPAAWKRPGSDWFADEFYCSKHHLPCDVAIVQDVIVRRVRVELHVLMTSASMSAAYGHVEALARLEAAVLAAGGVLEVKGVHSTICTYPLAAGLEAAGRVPANPQ